MELTILGSGGCTVIPKPLCRCPICKEAREKGIPYERSGPSLFIHDENLLIDTPAEIALQLNRSGIDRIDFLMFTHLDPDHIEGFRVVEQIALDFRTWKAYPSKQMTLILPEHLHGTLCKIQSIYGPFMAFYEKSGFLKSETFRERTRVKELSVTALPIDRGGHFSTVYVLEKGLKKLIYAPCDIKPFPEERAEVQNADMLIVQPGIFETGLKHGFTYPKDHISRTTLYTFEETVELGQRLGAKKILFVHLEEYWNRSHADYMALQEAFDHIQFAYDGLRLTV